VSKEGRQDIGAMRGKKKQRAPSAGKHVTGASAGKHARRTKLSRVAVCCELFNRIKSVKFSQK